MYYYESHLGGIYTAEEALDYEDLYCEECGDSDTVLGYFESFREFLINYADNFYMYWDLKVVIDDIEPEFDYNEALSIVEEYKNN